MLANMSNQPCETRILPVPIPWMLTCEFPRGLGWRTLFQAWLLPQVVCDAKPEAEGHGPSGAGEGIASKF